MLPRATQKGQELCLFSDTVHLCRLVNFLIFLRIHHERLEIEPTAKSDMDFSKIVKDRKPVVDKTKKEEEKANRIESKEDNFIDDPDVPPLI